MEAAHCIGEIVLSIPGDDRCLCLLNLIACHAARKARLSEKDVEHICLAVVEAGTKAIRHGNLDDPKKNSHTTHN